MNRLVSFVLCLALPLLIVASGLALAWLYGVPRFAKLTEENGRGVVPEGLTLTLPEATRYRLWMYVKGGHGGQLYEGPEKLPPGAAIHVFTESGRSLSTRDRFDISKHFGGEKAVSLGTFETTRPDQTVEIDETGLREPVLVGVAPAIGGRTIGVLLSVGAIVVVSLSLAIIVFFVFLHRRQRMLAVDGTS